MDELQAGIKFARRNINNLIYADDTTLTAESEEEVKEPLDKGGRRKRKIWLKTQYSKIILKYHGIWSPLHGQWRGKKWKQ